jgi:hypothetical protein
MRVATVSVLLVGDSEEEFSSLLQPLEKRGCQCQFVPSCLDAGGMVAQASFDLVLCSSQIKGFQTLLDAACRSSASLFRYFPVEDGCWWVPVAVRGERCLDAPALRPSEFAKALDAMVRDAKGSAPSIQVMAA